MLHCSPKDLLANTSPLDHYTLSQPLGDLYKRRLAPPRTMP